MELKISSYNETNKIRWVSKSGFENKKIVVGEIGKIERSTSTWLQ